MDKILEKGIEKSVKNLISLVNHESELKSSVQLFNYQKEFNKLLFYLKDNKNLSENESEIYRLRLRGINEGYRMISQKIREGLGPIFN